MVVGRSGERQENKKTGKERGIKEVLKLDPRVENSFSMPKVISMCYRIAGRGFVRVPSSCF